MLVFVSVEQYLKMVCLFCLLTDTVSMMNASANMVMPMFGSSSQSFSTTCLWQLSLKTKSSACMAVFRPVSTLLTRSDNSIECRRRHTRDPSATCFGRIPTIGAVGASHPAVPATHSARTSQSNSTTRTTWQESLVPISWSWMDTIGLMSATLWLFSPLQTIATDAATKPPLWRSTSSWSTTCKFLALHAFYSFYINTR